MFIKGFLKLNEENKETEAIGNQQGSLITSPQDIIITKVEEPIQQEAVSKITKVIKKPLLSKQNYYSKLVVEV